MKQPTKHILFFFFISILGYSQNIYNKYSTNFNSEIYFPELNDINEVKYVKTIHYKTDLKKKFLNYFWKKQFYIDEFPYRYIYEMHPEKNDTIYKAIYKYYENERTLEYVKEYNYISNENNNWYYHKEEKILTTEYFVKNRLTQTQNFIYNSKKLVIREELVISLPINSIGNMNSFKDLNYTKYYLYNDANQLVKKINISDKNINDITYWNYNDSTHSLGNVIMYEEGIESKIYKEGNDRIIKHENFAELSKSSLDKHGNWTKKTYKEDKGYSITEREIIYK